MKRFVPDLEKLRSPLARRMIVAIVLVSSTITLCLTAFQLYGEYRGELENIQDNFRQIEEVHLKSLSQSLWATNEAELQLQIEGIVNVPNIEYIIVREGDRIWAQAGHRASRKIIERQYPVTYVHRGQTLEIGRLTVVASLDAIYHGLLNRAFIVLASNAVKTFLVAGFAFVFFHWLVTRHLLSIAGYLRGVDLCGRALPLTLVRAAGRQPDELDEVAAQLNRMLDAQQAGQAQLRESEERLRLAVDAAHMGTFDWDIPRNHITWSRWHEELWGYKPGEFDGTYEAFSGRVHHDDFPGTNAEVTRCIATREPFEREFRVVWPDGSVHWILGRGDFTFGVGVQPEHMRGVAVEITEHKRAERILRNYAARLQVVSRKLLEVQEDERRRIARELHDQVGQVLTALKINLQVIERQPAAGPVALQIEECARIADTALQQVRLLMLDLRPPQLDELGLAASLRMHAERVVTPASLALHFSAPAVLPKMLPAIEIVCFRIAQETLTNILRHAGARNVWIELAVDGDEVKLTIRDDGKGFDLTEAHRRAMGGGSIGLLSMEERAALAGGRIEIITAPGAGTTVRAMFSPAGAADNTGNAGPA